MNDFIYDTPTKIYFGKDQELEVGRIIKGIDRLYGTWLWRDLGDLQNGLGCVICFDEIGDGNNDSFTMVQNAADVSGHFGLFRTGISPRRE